MSLFHRNAPTPPAYDRSRERPAIRKSICTGEMTAGMIDLKTGKFRDIMRVDGQRGIDEFCRSIGARPDDIKIIY